MYKIEGKSALVTGANRGIGLEFAHQYADRGWRVIATCRKQERSFFGFLQTSIAAKLNGLNAPSLLPV